MHGPTDGAPPTEKSTDLLDRPIPSGAPQERVVLQKEPPRADLQVDVKRAGDHTIVQLAGRISETFKGEELGRRLVGNVILDTRQVDRITSFGVRAWLSMLDAMDADALYFVRCSEAVLSQMSMIRSFAGNGEVISFFAPYLCDSCGNTFSVLYDALDDAESIAGCRAVDIPCPRCRTSSTLDDDPASFFRISPLLEARSEALSQALGKLPPLGADADPIEKTIRENLTVVKFNTRLDASVRLRRVFDGLEGRTRFDLSSVPEVTDRGVSTFLRALDGLDPEIRRVQIVGCPQELAVALAQRRVDERVRVLSVVAQAVCKTPPTQRHVFIDLLDHGDDLAAGRPLDLRCDWCDDELTFPSAQETLRELAIRLDPDRASSVGPSPAVASSTPRRRWSLGLWLGSAAFIGSAMLLLVVGVGLLGALYVMNTQTQTDPDAWVAGKTAPPPWTTDAWLRDGDGIAIVAGADADDVEAALEIAREKAMFTLVERLSEEMKGSSIYGFLPSRRRSTDPESEAAIRDAYIDAVTPWGLPEREKVAVREGGARTRVFARYRLSTSEWERAKAHFAVEKDFRGVRMGRRFPTMPATPASDVVVLGIATWLPAPAPGSRLLRVGDVPVTSLEQATEQLETQWTALPAGASLELVFATADAENRVPFQKKAAP